MISLPATYPFLTGLTIGFGGSLAGAIVDYVNARRKAQGFRYGGLMLVVAGLINTTLGVIAIITSLVVTGSILTAVIMGLGVLAGFAAGFLSIAAIWVWFGDKNETGRGPA